MDYRYHCYIPAENGRNTLPINPCTPARLHAAQARRRGRPGRVSPATARSSRSSSVAGPPSPSATARSRPSVAAPTSSPASRTRSTFRPGQLGHHRGGWAGGDRAAQRAQRPRPSTRTSSSRIGSRPAGGGRPTSPALPPDPHRDLAAGPAGREADRRRDVHPVRELEHLPAAPPQGTTTCRSRPSTRRCTTSGSTRPTASASPRLHRRRVRGELHRPRPRACR